MLLINPASYSPGSNLLALSNVLYLLGINVVKIPPTLMPFIFF